MDSDSDLAAEEGAASFGIKKIVDCKIGKCGRQMYKVKWIATWEPAENLTSVQHLIDEFWKYVDHAKTQETLAAQHFKQAKIDSQIQQEKQQQQQQNQQQRQQQHLPISRSAAVVATSIDKMSDSKKLEVQNLIARTNETSVSREMLINNLNAGQLPPQMVSQGATLYTGTAVQQFSGGTQQMGNKTYPTFGQNCNSEDQKGKIPMIGNKRSLPHQQPEIESEDSKSPMMNDSKVDAGSKALNNSGLKYLENFENPYVKILLACKVCNKEQSLKYPATWKRHFLTHADKQDLPHKCTYCEKRFVTSTNLKNHMKTHLKHSLSGIGTSGSTGTAGSVGTASKIKEEPWYNSGMQHHF